MVMFPINPSSSMVAERYWFDLISTSERILSLSDDNEASDVISLATIEPNVVEVDELYGELYYTWEIVLKVEPENYVKLLDKKTNIENRILNCLNDLHHDETNSLCAIRVEPIVKRYLHWEKALPKTKTEVLALIEEQKTILTAVATGTSYMRNGLEESYQKRHQEIVRISSLVGFDYPVGDSTLASWWQTIKEVETYAARRSYIDELFEPLCTLLHDSMDNPIDVTKHSASNKSVLVALKDAQAYIDAGKFPNAVDRIHTAFHGYLRETLEKHQIPFNQTESISALLTKLYEYYYRSIQPPQVASKIKKVLRGSGGIVQSVNEMRNNNTIAHPTDQLIEKREAELMVRLVDALFYYIEDIEQLHK